MIIKSQSKINNYEDLFRRFLREKGLKLTGNISFNIKKGFKSLAKLYLYDSKELSKFGLNSLIIAETSVEYFYFIREILEDFKNEFSIDVILEIRNK